MSMFKRHGRRFGGHTCRCGSGCGGLDVGRCRCRGFSLRCGGYGDFGGRGCGGWRLRLSDGPLEGGGGGGYVCRGEFERSSFRRGVFHGLGWRRRFCSGPFQRGGGRRGFGGSPFRCGSLGSCLRGGFGGGLGGGGRLLGVHLDQPVLAIIHQGISAAIQHPLHLAAVGIIGVGVAVIRCHSVFVRVVIGQGFCGRSVQRTAAPFASLRGASQCHSPCAIVGEGLAVHGGLG